MMLSRRRHALLIEGLEHRAEPLGASTHFRLYSLTPPGARTSTADECLIVHDFRPDQIDNDVGYYVVTELMPLLTALGDSIDTGYSEQDVFERSVGDIVRSMAGNERRAWRLFYDNTLAALEARPGLGPIAAHTTEADFIGHFSAIYGRCLDLIEALSAETPPSVLDVATCFGFFPLLLARTDHRSGRIGAVTGCDLNPALIDFAADYVRHYRLDRVDFTVADILAADIERELVPLPARFDAVTALHLLEHLEPEQTTAAVANLWRLTGRRLIVTVPLEATPDPRYGHRQVFDCERLLAIGRGLGGRCEVFEHYGGWLVADRRH